MDSQNKSAPEDEAVERIVVDALTSQEEEHEELLITWRLLNGRSKGAFVIAALFVTGVLLFIRYFTPEDDSRERMGLCISAALGALSAVVSLVALLIRASVSTPECKKEIVSALLDSNPVMDEDRRAEFYEGKVREWTDASEKVRRINQRKSTVLLVSQLCVAAGILCAIVVVFLRFWE